MVNKRRQEDVEDGLQKQADFLDENEDADSIHLAKRARVSEDPESQYEGELDPSEEVLERLHEERINAEMNQKKRKSGVRRVGTRFDASCSSLSSPSLSLTTLRAP
jgi:hypothetical protein